MSWFNLSEGVELYIKNPQIKRSIGSKRKKSWNSLLRGSTPFIGFFLGLGKQKKGVHQNNDAVLVLRKLLCLSCILGDEICWHLCAPVDRTIYCIRSAIRLC